MSGPSPDFTHEAEMGFSHRELLRALPSAAQPFQVRAESATDYVLEHGERRVNLSLNPEMSRSIASITLPVTRIHMAFFGFDEIAYDGFMNRFKKYLQRGGG